MTPRTQIAVASLVSGAFTGMGIGAFAAKTSVSKKPPTAKYVLGGAFIGIVSSILPALILPMFLGDKESMGRMGLYIPAPTVKKYPAFAGTQYYS